MRRRNKETVSSSLLELESIFNIKENGDLSNSKTQSKAVDSIKGLLQLAGIDLNFEKQLSEQDIYFKEILDYDWTIGNLSEMGISDEKSARRLLDAIQSVKNNRNKKEAVNEWDIEKVQEWLIEVGWERVSKNFNNAGINGFGLLRLTEDDLRNHLQITNIKDRKGLFSVITNLKIKSAFDLSNRSQQQIIEQERKHELITVYPMPPLELKINDKNLERMKSDTIEDNTFSPVITFTGPTGSGKSHLLTELLDFEDRVNEKGPGKADTLQAGSTTVNIQLYKGEVILGNEKIRLNLLDIEGADGRPPLRLKENFKNLLQQYWDEVKTQIWSYLKTEKEEQPSSSDAALNLLAKRNIYVANIFPQLAYLLSNVIVYVNTQPLQNTAILRVIESFTEKSIRNSSQKPDLIIIQNKYNGSPSESNDAFDPDISTKIFKDEVKNDLDSLLQKYRSVHFVRFPEERFPEKYNMQIQRIKSLIAKLVTENPSWTLQKGSVFTQLQWLKSVEEIARRFKENPSDYINLSEVFFYVCKPAEPKLRRVQQFFSIVHDKMKPEFWKPYFQTYILTEFAKNRLSIFLKCRKLTIELFADLLLQQLKENGNVDEKVIQNNEVPFKKNLEELLKFLNDRAPCQAKEGDSICNCEKMIHTSGHSFYSSVVADAMRPIFNLMSSASTCSSEFKGFDELDDIEGNMKILTDKIRELNKLTDEELFMYRVNFLKQNLLKDAELISDMNYCMACWKEYTKSNDMVLYTCGHLTCESCFSLFKKKEKYCLICSSQHTPVVNKRIPDGAAPRLLSIRGENRYEALNILKILKSIEETTNLKITDLFDMIGATSFGGLIAAEIVEGCQLSNLQQTHNVESRYFPLFGQTVADSTKDYVADRDKVNIPDKPMIANANDKLKLLLISKYADDSDFYFFSNYNPKYRGDNLDTVDFSAKFKDAVEATTNLTSFLYNNQHLKNGVDDTTRPSDITIKESEYIHSQQHDIMVSLLSKGGYPSERNFSIDKIDQTQDLENVCKHLLAKMFYVTIPDNLICGEHQTLVIKERIPMKDKNKLMKYSFKATLHSPEGDKKLKIKEGNNGSFTLDLTSDIHRGEKKLSITIDDIHISRSPMEIKFETKKELQRKDKK